MDTLPGEISAQILSYCGLNDLLKLRACSKSHKTIAELDIFWKKLLASREPDLISTGCKRSGTYFERFLRRKSATFKVASAWAFIEQYMNPSMHNSLRRGASILQIAKAQNEIGLQFPEELRASYLIHDGQWYGGNYSTTPGLLESAWLIPLSDLVVNYKDYRNQYSHLDDNLIPISHVTGIYQWFVSTEEPGAVSVSGGWNKHIKAESISQFLIKLLK